MNGSGTIQVVKRDGSSEPFNSCKLTSAILRVAGKRLKTGQIHYLSDAVLFYISRSGSSCASTSAIFEMCVKMLQYICENQAAQALQDHRAWRTSRRRNMRIRHEANMITMWDKSWLAEIASRSWHISPRTARIIAAEVEIILLNDDANMIDRETVIDILNEQVAAFGLADAVPAKQN